VGVSPERSGQAAAILAHSADAVAGQQAEVEALEGRLADAAEPSRKGGHGGSTLIDLEPGLQPANRVALTPIHPG
jgi:hypothetical protein